MTKDAMIPFGRALKAYYNGNKETKVNIIRDDGYLDTHPIAFYFRDSTNFSEIEKKAINLCRGKTLDLGAGVGPHSLELQKRGIQVDALDISPEACEIMKQRGIRNVLNTDIYSIKNKQYDTILALNRSIGFVGTLKGMETFLLFVKNLLSPDGKLIFDIFDIRNTEKRIHKEYQEHNLNNGRYIGEIRFQIEYDGERGEMFEMLQIDPDKLLESCWKTGWNMKILTQTSHGDYLVELTLADQ